MAGNARPLMLKVRGEMGKASGPLIGGIIP